MSLCVSFHVCLYFLSLSVFFFCLSLCLPLLSLCDSLRVSLSYPSGVDLPFSLYTVTSKSAVLTWSKYAGSSSYRLTASLRSSPNQSVFTAFGQNTVMGSVTPLYPNSAYTFKVEALDGSMVVLASATVDGYTGMYNTNNQIKGIVCVFFIILSNAWVTYLRLRTDKKFYMF